MISNCVYTYVLQNLLYLGDKADKTKEVLGELIKSKEINPDEAFVTYKPIPLIIENKIAPVEWYYSLFTVEELESALENYDSPFPTKVFLVFEAIEPITLGDASKELVRFEVVDKKNVDACINEVLRQA